MCSPFYVEQIMQLKKTNSKQPSDKYGGPVAGTDDLWPGVSWFEPNPIHFSPFIGEPYLTATSLLPALFDPFFDGKMSC